MQKYLFAYHGSPQFTSPEEGQKHMVDWRAWSSGLGASMVDPGMPVTNGVIIGREGITEASGASTITGITIVQAETPEQAYAMAKSCPHITAGGTIEVSEAMDMEM